MDQHLLLFTLFVFGIIIIPGMDMAYVLSSSLVDGRRAGLAAVGGMVTGGAAHTVMGAAGVGLLFALVPALFHAVLLAGALYVAWMGLSLWRSPATLADVPEGKSRSLRTTFLRAAATCLMNPKAYLFMVAVFPQFVRPENGSLLRQMVLLGVIIAVTQAVVYGAVALGGAGLRARLAKSVRAQVVVGRCVAALLVLTAVWAVWQGWAAAR